MERVETLCNKLLEQLSQKASADVMLFTVQMLHSELIHIKASGQTSEATSSVAIDMPVSFENAKKSETEHEAVPQEKTVEVLQIDEAEVAAELDEIKKNAEAKNSMGAQHKPQFLFDAVEDTPTLIQQRGKEIRPGKELHETISNTGGDSLNEKLRSDKIELSDTLQDLPVKDLKKAIDLNDRFLFITELFRGDDVMYERSIKTINAFSIYPEAEYWIKRELKLKLGWDDKSAAVRKFDQLIKRRFSVT